MFNSYQLLHKCTINNSHSGKNDSIKIKLLRRKEMTNIKKLVKVVMAFVLLLGLTVTFVGNASAETTYAGDGEYTVNVYHNENMTTQPMKGKVDNAFKSATVTKVGEDRYNVVFHTKGMTFMLVKGKIVEMTIDGVKNVSGPDFSFTNVNLDQKGAYLTKNISCKMELAGGLAHKDVTCYVKLTKK